MSTASGTGEPDGEPVPEPFFDDGVDPFTPPPFSEPAWAPPAEQAAPAGGAWAPPTGPPVSVAPPAPAPGQPGPYANPPAEPAERQPAHRLAVASLVCSVAGFITYGAGGVIGIILGVLALRRIDAGAGGGRSLAIAGIVVGAAMIVFGGIELAIQLGAIDPGSSYEF